MGVAWGITQIITSGWPSTTKINTRGGCVDCYQGSYYGLLLWWLLGWLLWLDSVTVARLLLGVVTLTMTQAVTGESY